jgi:hypothetical protein
MKLPSGFTGYSNEAPNLKAFKKLCFSLEALNFFKVLTIFEYKYPDNYFKAEVSDGRNTFLFLQNCYVPYAAFRERHEESSNYIDKSITTEIITLLGSRLTILNTEFLNQEITKYHQEDLNLFEIKELKRWLPCTVGQALFSSYFD